MPALAEQWLGTCVGERASRMSETLYVQVTASAKVEKISTAEIMA
jgi:hypothetical protein